MVQDIGDRLHKAIGKQIEKVIYFLSAENISPNLAVHEIRKSFKRMRALLKLYRHPGNDYPVLLSKQIAEMGRALAPVRDSYIAVQVFEKLAKDNQLISERKLRSVKEQLNERNKNLVRQIFEDTGILDEIQDFMKSMKADLDERLVYPGNEGIVVGLAASAEKCHRIYNETGNTTLPGELHRLRKKLKVLWYQVEFIKFVRPKYFSTKADQLHKVTELLGDDHDLFVFQNLARTGGYNLYQLELEVLENQIRHLHELNLHKIHPRLKSIFSEPVEAFVQKMEESFRDL